MAFAAFDTTTHDRYVIASSRYATRLAAMGITKPKGRAPLGGHRSGRLAGHATMAITHPDRDTISHVDRG